MVRSPRVSPTIALLLASTALALGTEAGRAQTAPAGAIIDLGTGTPSTVGVYTPYSVTVTAQTSGLYYSLFAFREVPAFFRFDDAAVTPVGTSINLLTNPGFEDGSTPGVTNSGVQVPIGWGTIYQTGTVPSAAGTVTNTQGAHTGSYVWYDGSVQSFDGIYQTFTATAGQQYLISFYLEADDAFQTPTIEVAAYFGACGASNGSCASSFGNGFQVNQQASPTINTTGGDLQPANRFSLSSSAANASTVEFQGGTLVMQGGAFAGNIIPTPVTIDATNGTVDTTPASGGFSGVVSGPGSLTIVGTHTFLLSNANTYSGGTVLNGGTLAIGANASLGTGALAMANGTTLVATTGITLANSVSLTGTDTIATSDTTDQGDGLVLNGVVSGTGTLVKTGASGLRLAGDNTYTGGTLLQAGHIGIASNTSLGTGTLTFAGGFLRAHADGFTVGNTAVLQQDGAIDTNGYGLTYAGTISGDGRLSKEGAGTLTLTAANSYGNGTILNAGVLAVGNSAALGTGALTVNAGTLQAAADGLSIANAASLAGNATIDTQTFGLTYAGAIAGTGQLTKIGAGTLTLTAADTYAGGTVLGAGTIAVGNSTALGTGTLTFGGGTLQAAADGLTIANAASLASNTTIDTRAFGLTDGGVIAGAGQLTKVGGGTLTLTAANTYTGGTALQGGVLAIGVGGALGTGRLAMDDGTTLRFIASGLTVANAIALTGVADPTIDTGSGSQTISGAISGSGALTKTGTGTLDLTDTDTYSGATTVAQGTLLIDGALVNSITTVGSGAILGGHGSVAGLVVGNGGTLTPTTGGGLTVTGQVSLLTGSTYQVTINGDGTNSALKGGGSATLGGGRLSLLAGSGTIQAGTYTLLTAAGGVNGTFGSLTAPSSFALLDTTVSYGADDVLLTLRLANFRAIAATANQAAAAGAIEALGSSSALYNAVVGQTRAGAQQAFASASGVSHASSTAIIETTTRFTSGLVIDRLWDVSGSGLSAQEVLRQFAPDQLPTLVRCYGPVVDPKTAVPPQTYTAWGEGFGSFGHSNAGPNAGALDRSLGGFILGIDTPLSGVFGNAWRGGVAGGYTDTSYTSHLDGGTGTVQGVYGSLYGGARYGAVDIRVGTTVAGNFVDGRRTVAFPGFLEAERSHNSGYSVQTFGEVGYRIAAAQVVIEPVAGAAFLHTSQDGFTEKGGAAALAVAPLDNDLGTTTLGVRGEIAPLQGVPLVAHGFLGWQHVIGDVSPATTLAFAAAPANTFSVNGTPIDRDALAAALSIDYRATAALDIGLSYDGLIGATASEHGVKGRAEYKF